MKNLVGLCFRNAFLRRYKLNQMLYFLIVYYGIHTIQNNRGWYIIRDYILFKSTSYIFWVKCRNVCGVYRILYLYFDKQNGSPRKNWELVI